MSLITGNTPAGGQDAATVLRDAMFITENLPHPSTRAVPPSSRRHRREPAGRPFLSAGTNTHTAGDAGTFNLWIVNQCLGVTVSFP